MRRSLSEIQAMCTKAARGAGCPWGLAEEAGMNARILEAHGLPGTEALVNLLNTPRACSRQAADQSVACGLKEAATLSDQLAEGAQTIGATAGALLMVAPLIDDAQAPGRVWRIAWPEGQAICTAEGVALIGAWPQAVSSSVEVTPLAQKRMDEKSRWSHSSESREIDGGVWSSLEGLAAQTYVPETEASRAAGAGPSSADRD